MEWLKAKYDRLLLGVFGVIALLVGGLLVTKAVGAKGGGAKRPDPKPRAEWGTTDAAQKLKAAQDRLAEAATVKEVMHAGTPISLFVSTPLLKKAGESDLIAIKNPESKEVRPGIQNLWLYDNNLPITRKDVAEMDPDGDHFTNLEEFKAKTNPRDPKSTPPFTEKVSYVQCVKDPLTLKFQTYISDTDLSIRRTEPADKACNTPVEFKVGDSFSGEKGSKEPRFKLEKVLPPAGNKKEIAVLTDLLTKKQFQIEKDVPFALPTLRARVRCTLGKEEEKVVALDEEFYFEVNPDAKFKVESITEEELVVSFTPEGGEKKSVTLKIPTPP